jgi:type VI secretion system secreted protein Hcp
VSQEEFFMKVHKASFATVAACARLFAALPFVVAPTPCNLLVDGHPGSSEKEGRENTSDVFELSHALTQPYDPFTGLPTGLRQHSPLRVTKIIDKASPGLHKALASGEVIATVQLDFYRIDPDTRTEVAYYTITLTNARVVEVRTFMPTSFLPANESYRHMEEVSFVYQGIVWNWLPDAIVESDEWVSGGP